MTITGDELRREIETLYRVFARYEVPLEIHAAQGREPEALRRQLTAAPLCELDLEALGAYSGWAMTTVDGSEMYRHFLPRILELALEHGPHMGLAPSVIAHKLEYGEWKTWPQGEHDAVAHFFQIAWEHTLEDEHVDPDWFLGIARAGLNVDRALECWQHNNSRGALLKCARVIGLSIGRIDGEVVIAGTYWDDVPIELRRKITDWLLSPERRAHFVAALTMEASELEDHWILQQGIATWDRLSTVP